MITTSFIKRSAAIFLLISTLLLTMCSCSEKVASDTGSEAEFVEFTDALGRNVSVKKKPERAAALIGSFADVWLLSGGTLCAAAEDAWQDFGFESDTAINIGGAHSPNVELLLSAAPEFVIASASTASNIELLDVLSQSGITVAYFDVDSFEDYLKMLDICTDITGRKDLYEKNGISVSEKISDIKNRFNKSSLQSAKKTVLLLRASSGKVKAKGSSGTILGELLYDMGCVNIADSENSILENLSLEAIIENDPYNIFIVTMGNDEDAAKRSFIKMTEENPAWQELSAIRDNRVYFMEKSLFNLKPNARWAESYEKLFEILTKQT